MGLRIVPDSFHEIRLDGRRLLFHIASTALFELDAVGRDVIDWARDSGEIREEDISSRFSGIHPTQPVLDAIEDFRALDLLNESGRPSARKAEIAIRDLPLSTIVLNVNTGCNLSCTYCYKEDLVEPALGKRMDFDTAVRSVEMLLREAADRPSINVVFFGGEPLTNLPLIRQVVDYCERRCAELGKRADFSLTTNGTLLTEEIVDWLDAHRFGLTVSMDGPKALHDRNRRTVGGKGSYDAILPKVRMLLARYTSRPVGARVTLTTGVTDVVAIHRHLRDELGFFEVGFSPVTSGSLTAFNLKPDELAAVFSGFQELGRAYYEAALQGGNTGFANMHQLMTDLWEGRRKALPCGAGFQMLAVDHQGDLHLCHRFTGSALPTFGNVESGVAKERLTGFLDEARDLSGRPCETCRIRSLCAGGCYHESYARYGDPLTPTLHYCDLMRDWIDFGVSIYARLLEKRPDFFTLHVAPRKGAAQGATP